MKERVFTKEVVRLFLEAKVSSSEKGFTAMRKFLFTRSRWKQQTQASLIPNYHSLMQRIMIIRLLQ